MSTHNHKYVATVNLSPEIIEKAQELAKKGWMRATIANHLNISTGQVLIALGP